jgi:hypothetical protein
MRGKPCCTEKTIYTTNDEKDRARADRPPTVLRTSEVMELQLKS